MEKTIYINGKIIGYVKDDIFVKRVHGHKHFLRQPPAIANDIDILEQVENYGAKICQIVDKDSGKTYYAYIKTIWKKGFKLNRGFGEQIALGMNWWSNDKNHIKTTEETAEQERLFQ